MKKHTVHKPINFIHIENENETKVVWMKFCLVVAVLNVPHTFHFILFILISCTYIYTVENEWNWRKKEKNYAKKIAEEQKKRGKKIKSSANKQHKYFCSVVLRSQNH